MKIELKKPLQNGKKRKQPDVIRIDPWDTWDAQCTAARILEPILIQFKQQSIGVPQSMFEPGDPVNKNGVHTKVAWRKAKKRWNAILDEMIWALHQCHDDAVEISILQNKKLVDEKLNEYYNRIQTGLKLFAIHFRDLWW